MAFGLGAMAMAPIALTSGVGPVAMTMGAMGAAAGYGFTGQTYQQRLETYKVLMMGASVAYEFAALGAQFSHAAIDSMGSHASQYGQARLADGQAKQILSIMNKPEERTPMGGQGLQAILDRVENSTDRRIPVNVGQGASDNQLQDLANDYGSLEAIYRHANEEQRAIMRAIFAQQAAAVQQAATASGAEPVIQFLSPGDPRRRPKGVAPVFGPALAPPTVAQQMALADGQAAGALGAVSTGPALDPRGGITVPLAAVQGFQRPAASARGRRSKGALALKDHISLQTSHGGHAHGPTYIGTDQHAMAIGNRRAAAAMEARGVAAALALRGGYQR